MSKFVKLLAWLFLLGIIFYVVLSVRNGQANLGGDAVVTGIHEGRQVEILKMPVCTDTDKGKEYRWLGQTYNTYDNKVYDDYCEDEDTLVEYFCNNDYPDRINVNCDCFKGACF